jgi:phage gp36-like protein
MFIEQSDLGAVVYDYQIDQLTDGDDSLVIQAIEAATDEVKSYLYENNKAEHLDGRLRYDVEAIFSASGSDRNALLLRHCITVAKWYLVEICNADMIYELAKERYDRATSYLNKLAKGERTLASLPQLSDEKAEELNPIRYGSRTKFNHDY